MGGGDGVGENAEGSGQAVGMGGGGHQLNWGGDDVSRHACSIITDLSGSKEEGECREGGGGGGVGDVMRAAGLGEGGGDGGGVQQVTLRVSPVVDP